ncbi:hypothetical protein COOONC_21349 [Cooperia oncophora]
MPSQISVDNIRSASSSLEDEYSPVSVVSPKIPSVAESVERDGAVSEREEIETVSVKGASARSPSIADVPAEEEVHEDDEKASPSSSSTPSQVDPADLPQPSKNEIDRSSSTPTDKSGPEDVAPEEAVQTEKQKARDEIRSLLGDLPPIAKPRLTKAPSEFSNLALFADQGRHGTRRSDSSGESTKSDDTTVERHRTVVFTDPLHRSIPPSETSSGSSPPPKPAVRLPASGGRSVIRARQETQQEEDMSDSDENRTVSIFIDRIYIPEFSRLLYPIYDNVKVYVDWSVLFFYFLQTMIHFSMNIAVCCYCY